jgi:hypothetical protein
MSFVLRLEDRRKETTVTPGPKKKWQILTW